METEIKDQDGMNEWDLNIFDVNNPSEPLHEFQGSFGMCVIEAVGWVNRNSDRQVRVVVEQIR